MNIKFNIEDISLDYDLLGEYPLDIETKKDEEIFEYFFEIYKFTFIKTEIGYLGDFKKIKELIKNHEILKEIEFGTLSNKKKWISLLYVTIDLFYQLYDNFFAKDTLDLIIRNFNNLSEEYLLNIVKDFNFSLFFSFSEITIVTPDKTNKIKATDDDCFLLKDLLLNKNEIMNIFNKIKMKDINKERFMELFNMDIPKDYKNLFYNDFILTWIDMLESDFDETYEFTEKEWMDFSTETYFIVYMWTVLILEEDKVSDFTKRLYSAIVTLVKNKYCLSFEILEISVIE